MKIVIDAANSLAACEKGGISYLMEDFLSALARVDEENDYLIFGLFWRDFEKKTKGASIPGAKNFKLVTKKFPNALLNLCEEKFKIRIAERLLSGEKASVFHAISGTKLPLLKNMKRVLSIYDLSFELHPEWYAEKWHTGIRNSAEKADAVITHAHFTAEKIQSIYGIERKKISVIPLGVNRRIFKEIKKGDPYVEAFLKKYSLPERYLFTIVTSSFERKNTANLLKAYKEVLQAEPDLKLFAVLGSESLRDGFVRLVKGFELEGQVFFHVEAERREMPYFYGLSELFLFPSRYEGFGLPVLEAMACGVPVVASNATSLPEVLGESGFLVNPESSGEIAEAVDEILTNENLRRRMISSGLDRAEQFTWEKSAARHLDVYRAV